MEAHSIAGEEKKKTNSMHIVKKKKNLFHNQVHTDNPSQKKTMLGPQEQDRVKVTMNKYPVFCHNVHHLNFGKRVNDL